MIGHVECERMADEERRWEPPSRPAPPRREPPKSALVALLLALTGGCSGEVLPVILIKPSTGLAKPEPELPESVIEGCALLGLDCYPDDDDDQRGAIVLLMTDPQESRVLGYDLASGACHKAAWVIDHAQTVGHEIGHTFGLEHSDDPRNVMYYSELLDGIPELTAKQERQVHRRVARFVGGCP